MSGSGATLITLLLCALMGGTGQLIRAILTLKQTGNDASGPNAQNPFSLSYLIFSLVIGAVAGVLYGLVKTLKEIDDEVVKSSTPLFEIAAAGYLGVDFIEGAFNNLKSRFQFATAPTKPAVQSGDGNTTDSAPAVQSPRNDVTTIPTAQLFDLFSKALAYPGGQTTQKTTPETSLTLSLAPIYGVDCENYPGDEAMEWLRARGSFRVTVLYLANKPGVQNTSWTTQYGYLRKNGWGLLPTYAGLQKDDPKLSATSGKSHGEEAAGWMKTAGFAESSIVYLDLESGDTPIGLFLDYIKAWITAVQAANYTPGLYCSHNLVGWVRNTAKLTDFIWCWDVPNGTMGDTYDPAKLPAGSVVAGSIATQYRQKVKLTGLTIPPSVDKDGLDLSLCLVADPSNLATCKHALNL